MRWPNIFLVEVLGRGNRLEWYHRIPWEKEDLMNNQQEKTLPTEELQLIWKRVSPQQKLRPDANEIKCIANHRHSANKQKNLATPLSGLLPRELNELRMLYKHICLLAQCNHCLHPSLF